MDATSLDAVFFLMMLVIIEEDDCAAINFGAKIIEKGYFV